ncbi:MAG: hypothetical protein QM698_14175 [Micropepsaceae bacterium]
MARPEVAAALTPAERVLVVALGRMFETADAEPVEGGRVAIVVCGCLFDAFLGALDEVESGDGREPDLADFEDDGTTEASLGAVESYVTAPGWEATYCIPSVSQEHWAQGDDSDLEIENEHHDPAEHALGEGSAFEMSHVRGSVWH